MIHADLCEIINRRQMEQQNTLRDKHLTEQLEEIHIIIQNGGCW
jgi:hypothetical protein